MALSKGDIRRILILSVCAIIILIFILRGVIQKEEPIQATGPTQVQREDSTRPETAPPEDRPDGRDIVIPAEGDLAALEAVQDYTALEVTDPGLIYLIRSVRDQTPEEIAARVDDTVRLVEVGANPEAYRGTYIRFAGTLDHMEPIWFPEGNPSGVERGFQGYIFDRQRQPVQFISIEAPDDLKVEHDTIMVEGPFYKIHTYVSVVGKELSFPLLVARSIQKIPDVTYEEAYPTHLSWIVVAIVVAVILVIGIATWRSARQDALAAERLRDRRQQKRDSK
jgi:hypothetical protein